MCGLGVIFVTRIHGVFPDENNPLYENFARSFRNDSHISYRNEHRTVLLISKRQYIHHFKMIVVAVAHFEMKVIDHLERITDYFFSRVFAY